MPWRRARSIANPSGAYHFVGDVLRCRKGLIRSRSGLVEVQCGDDAESQLAGEPTDFRDHGVPAVGEARRNKPDAVGGGHGKASVVGEPVADGSERCYIVGPLEDDHCPGTHRRQELDVQLPQGYQLAAVRRRRDPVDLPMAAVACQTDDLSDLERAGGLRPTGGQPQLGAAASQLPG
jgi:hypothetical protein